MIKDWPLNDEQRETVEQELAESRHDLFLVMMSGPQLVTRDGLFRWRQDLAVRRKEIARLERLLG